MRQRFRGAFPTEAVEQVRICRFPECVRRTLLVMTGIVSFGLICGEAAAQSSADRIVFNRDIRPVLADTCYQCHGPDSAQRQAELRLDTQSGLFGDSSNGPLVVAGHAEQSELYKRLATSDPDLRMPPTDSGRSLTASQIRLIAQWIDQGAEWQPHWSFVPPQRPAVPVHRVNFEDGAPREGDVWSRNAIDRFVLRGLRERGLRPSPPADRATLARRLSLTLIGLPPTPEQLDAVVNDPSPAALDRWIDQLLASPAYGERMAVNWMDLARYADTSGYQNDGPRVMWRWRDWVIDAFNANMPFDQFTIEQLAGDLLPQPTLQQRIATGFNRNHRGNAEGGIVPEEFAVEYVIDRVDTTFTVWQGLTVRCARCHEHKFDPLSQREFYQLYAFFNSIPESGRAIKEGNSPPFIKAPTLDQQRRLRELRQRAQRLSERRARAQQHLAAQRMELERSLTSGTPPVADWTISAGLQHLQPQAARPADMRPVELADVGDFGYFDRFTLAAWIRPPQDSDDEEERGLNGTLMSRMEPLDRGAGYSLHVRDGHLQLNLVKRWLDDSLRVETQTQLVPGVWQHVCAVYDGSRVADGIGLYINGVRQPLTVNLDAINQSFASSEPFRIGTGNSDWPGEIGEVRVYRRDLAPWEVQIVATRSSIAEILETPVRNRSAGAQRKLAEYLEAQVAPERVRALRDRELAAWQAVRGFQDVIPTVMVMDELPTPRPAYVLQRGEYDRPGERVQRALPAVFGEWPEQFPRNRLGLARWLVDRRNPLTARVTVNRVWQMHFGRGLVETAEDFGAQGTPPVLPELLDWLAVEFMESGWDLKALHRLIVGSATWQQSSRGTPQSWEQDPQNRWLSRGPRFRLPAEFLRDQALQISGLLVHRLGGPSVRPYQPEGLWKEIATDTNYEQSHGPNLYRRSLYTYGKRTVASPTMTVFDAGSRETCIVRRPTTNTPLQALTLMNDPTFVECARVLAQRVGQQWGLNDRVLPGVFTEVFRRATGRTPTAGELDTLQQTFRQQLQRFEDAPDAAHELLSVGESPGARDLASERLAALSVVCSLILNLDEVLSLE